MITSEWAPSTFTTGQYVGLLGDFRHYWIADALSMQIQRLNELYAKYTGQALEQIEKAMDRDKFLEADEAKAFGLIDEVFDTRPEPGEDAGTGAGDVTPS